MLDYSMSTGGLYPAPAPVDRIPTGFINPVSTDPVVNGNSYVCLVPFFNRLVQNSGLIQGTTGVLPGNGFIQNSSLTGSYTPIIMETTQTPALVRYILSLLMKNVSKKQILNSLFNTCLPGRIAKNQFRKNEIRESFSDKLIL